MSQGGLVPTRIDALGIEFPALDPEWLMLSVTLLVSYFWLAFVLSALTDWVAYKWETDREWHGSDRPARETLREAIETGMARGPLDKVTEPIRKRKLEERIKYADFSVRLRRLRFGFDFYLPPFVGFMVLLLLNGVKLR
jgi:hypothetical protein